MSIRNWIWGGCLITATLGTTHLLTTKQMQPTLDEKNDTLRNDSFGNDENSKRNPEVKDGPQEIRNTFIKNAGSEGRHHVKASYFTKPEESLDKYPDYSKDYPLENALNDLFSVDEEVLNEMANEISESIKKEQLIEKANMGALDRQQLISLAKMMTTLDAIYLTKAERAIADLEARSH